MHDFSGLGQSCKLNVAVNIVSVILHMWRPPSIPMYIICHMCVTFLDEMPTYRIQPTHLIFILLTNIANIFHCTKNQVCGLCAGGVSKKARQIS